MGIKLHFAVQWQWWLRWMFEMHLNPCFPLFSNCCFKGWGLSRKPLVVDSQTCLHSHFEKNCTAILKKLHSHFENIVQPFWRFWTAILMTFFICWHHQSLGRGCKFRLVTWLSRKCKMNIVSSAHDFFFFSSQWTQYVLPIKLMGVSAENSNGVLLLSIISPLGRRIRCTRVI